MIARCVTHVETGAVDVGIFHVRKSVERSCVARAACNRDTGAVHIELPLAKPIRPAECHREIAVGDIRGNIELEATGVVLRVLFVVLEPVRWRWTRTAALDGEDDLPRGILLRWMIGGNRDLTRSTAVDS